MVKKCVWCGQLDEVTSFDKEAHTIPKSLGGKNICSEVCDSCNSYFGNRNGYDYPIEIALKEMFNPTRFLLNLSFGQFGKGKDLHRFKSEIFDINFQQQSISFKKKFNLDKDSQYKFVRLFKRGLYKVFIEEIQRQLNRGNDILFNEIKNFSRYDIGDFPVFYWTLKRGAIYSSVEDISNPSFHFGKLQLRMINEIGYYEFMLFGHFFGIPLLSSSHSMFEEYVNRALIYKKNLFANVISIQKVSDIDIFLNRVNS